MNNLQELHPMPTCAGRDDVMMWNAARAEWDCVSFSTGVASEPWIPPEPISATPYLLIGLAIGLAVGFFLGTGTERRRWEGSKLKIDLADL